MTARVRVTTRSVGRGAVVAVAVGSLVATALAAPAAAAGSDWWSPERRIERGQDLWPSARSEEAIGAVAANALRTTREVAQRAASAEITVTWPSNGSARIKLARATANRGVRGASALATAGTEPAVRVLEPAAASRASVSGLMLRVDPGRKTATEPLSLTVDYSAFEGAFGGAWGSRLRAVALPACSLTTPELARCQEQTPLEATNDVAERTLTVSSLDAATSVVALTAAASGSTGDWTKTSLSPSATWSVATQTGAFSWSYSMRVPPAASGLQPSLALGYSSASVDGRVATTNNQTSWVGDGWDLWSGYIERKYVSCSDDMTDGASNASRKTGDLCWSDDNAFLSFEGQAVELVREGTSQVWRPKNDDGTRIEHRTGGWNDDDNGEYWVVTRTDGTRYYFGRGKVSSSGPELNSAWTVPVFGNHAGEACYDAGSFASSSCVQGWRWNLDFVEDLSGNAMTYTYVSETNKYGRNRNTAVSTYTRGGYLARIDYGQRADSPTTAGPQQVVFEVAERCVSDDAADCAAGALNDSTAQRWPDTPADLICTSTTSCPDVQSPAFFTRKRLVKVVTNTMIGGARTDVDSWTLTQTFPDPGGHADDTVMWLDQIRHRGLVGATAALPAVTFGAVQRDNRVDAVGDQGAPMTRLRLGAITSEAGGTTSVTYSQPQCNPSNLPAAPQSNTMLCFPVQWTPEGQSEPITEYFHKYVVTSVAQDPRDPSAQSTRVETTYDYQGAPAWHYDSNDLVPAKRRTWSDFRGYSKVEVRTGIASGTQSRVLYRYYRGMHGDHLPGGGAREVDIADETGVTDLEQFAGVLREQTTYNGSDIVSTTKNTPWRSSATAEDGNGHKAYRVAIATVETQTALTASPGTFRTTSKTTTYDGYGLPAQIEDRGDTSTAADDLCTRNTYVHDTAKNVIGLLARVETVSVACGSAPTRPKDVISDVRNYYDGSTSLNEPTIERGLVTKTEQVKSYADGEPSGYVTTQTQYDALGRPTKETDPLDRSTTTAYTPADNGPLTKTTVAAPKTGTYDHVTTTQINPAWGLAESIKDDGGRVTSAEYDPLGRVLKVWQPGRPKASSTPSITYAYTIGKAQASGVINAVETGVLNAAGTGYHSSVEIYDGLLRGRQTQAPSLSRDNPGTVLTDTIYDSRGLVQLENDDWKTDARPSAPQLLTPTEHVPGRTWHEYDGAGRETAQIFDVSGYEKWRTTTVYGGDRVTVTPPAGGTKQTTVTDARGNTTELIQYTGAVPATQTTTYSYDPAGRLLTMVDTKDNTWKNTYDLLGRVVSATDPDEGTTTTVYDDAGQIVSTKDARPKSLKYTYDELGRKTKLENGSIVVATWEYDTVSVGMLTSSSRGSGTSEYKTAVDAYDAAGRVLRQSVIVPASETGLAGTYTTKYTYTPGGQTETVTYPKLATPVSGTSTTVLAAETVTTTYDELSQPNIMSGGLGWGAYVAQARYSEYGEPLMLDLGGGYAQMINYAYEVGTRRLSGSWLVREGVSGYTMDTTYRYDNAGNLKAAVDKSSGTATKDYQCFTYDGLRRLTEAWTSTSSNCIAASDTALAGAAPYWTSYTYDSIGNRLKQTKHAAAGDTVTTYAHPASGANAVQPHSTTSATTTGASTSTTNYTFDKAGNMATRTTGTSTQELTWSADGLLARFEDSDAATDNFIYTGDGERLIRKDGSTKTLYLPGQELTYKSSSQAGTAVRYYTFGGKTVGSRTGSAAATARVLISDAQNTAHLSIASASNTVTRRYLDPFGNPRGSTSAWQGDHTFLDKPTDTNGLTQVGARYYDAKLGSFISVDPLLDLTDPQQWNGYAYANNNPTTWSDPTGLKIGMVGDWAKAPRPSAPAPTSSEPATPPRTTTPPAETRASAGRGESEDPRADPGWWAATRFTDSLAKAKDGFDSWRHQQHNWGIKGKAWIVMRKGKPGIHWGGAGGHQNRIEWDRPNGWHFNPNGKNDHLSVKEGFRALGRSAVSTLKTGAANGARLGARVVTVVVGTQVATWGSFVPPIVLPEYDWMNEQNRMA